MATSDLISNAELVSTLTADSIVSVSTGVGQPQKNIKVSDLATVVAALLPTATFSLRGLMPTRSAIILTSFLGIGDNANAALKIKSDGGFSFLLALPVSQGITNLIYVASNMGNSAFVGWTKIFTSMTIRVGYDSSSNIYIQRQYRGAGFVNSEAVITPLSGVMISFEEVTDISNVTFVSASN